LNYTDRAGMAVGVEVRVPLLDVDVVKFAAHVPPHLKQRGRVGKAIFKQAMQPYLATRGDLPAEKRLRCTAAALAARGAAFQSE
jgi:asparagine synthetase B (glutamine-hydrolysing)